MRSMTMWPSSRLLARDDLRKKTGTAWQHVSGCLSSFFAPITRFKKGDFMKLRIYEKKEVVKTYESDKYDLMFGTLEDVADAVKLDELKTGTDVEIIKMVGRFVFTSMDTVKSLMKDIFEGLTDDELKNTKVSDMATVLVDVVKFTIEQLNIGAKRKN